MSSTKLFVSADQLRIDSFRLGAKIIESNFAPDFLVALWRGGTPVGCYVHELLKYCGQAPDHIAVRTSRYTGVDEASTKVVVHNLSYLVEHMDKNSKCLVIDDVLDTGLSFKAFTDTLREQMGDTMPTDLRVATVFYKPSRNKTNRIPDYYMYETDRWIVFPHELEGNTLEEIREGMGKDVEEALRVVWTTNTTLGKND